MSRTIRVLAVTSLLSASSFALGQAIGPDLVNASMNDIARNGISADGTITGYSSGSVTCNRGDMPMAASTSSTVRPLVGMNMYRLKSFGSYSRFEQLGQGWVKWVGVPVNGTNSFCGSGCSGGGGGYMGVNCADVYSSGFNSPGGMGPRSQINPATGYLLGGRGTNTGEASISTRVQVPTSDVTNQPAGTRFFFETVDCLPSDAQYVRPGQRVAVNALNNATTQEININGGTSAPSMIGTPGYIPAIARWAQIDPSVVVVTADHDDTPNPSAEFPNTTIRCRYYIACQTTNLGGGQWRYEYAVFNLNSDRACGQLMMPMRTSAAFTDFSFRHPPSHSGEPFSNAAWTAAHGGNRLSFSTEKYAGNPNANAIRWGTTYNFGFTTDAPPAPGYAVLSLFKPGAVQDIVVPGIPTPAGCPADVNEDDAVTIDDLTAYLGAFSRGLASADLDNDAEPGLGLPDFAVTIDDLLYFLARYEGGC